MDGLCHSVTGAHTTAAALLWFISSQAGVATLASGYMLLLTPIPNWDNYLRCLVIKSKANEMDAESISSHSSVRSEGEETRNQGAEKPASEGTLRPPKRKKTTHKQDNQLAATATSIATEVRI